MTSDVTVTSFQMGSTPNLDTTSTRYSGRCVQSFASLSHRVATISLAVLVVWIFHGVLGGGRFYAPPSNSAPELRSDMRQVAFESSSKISKKILRSFLRSGQRSGHQRSSKSKCSRFSTISTILNFRRSLAREPEELERRGKEQTIAHLQPYLECVVRFDLRSMV